MIKPCLHLKAKSAEWGNVTLVDHLEQVAASAMKIAESFGLNESEIQIARIGAILHDIGKANPVFQERLNQGIESNEEIYRHEIGSLFFLPLFPRKMHPPLIEMIVAHHRSIKKDGREQGLLDLIDRFEREKRGGRVFEMHAQNWEIWQKDAFAILNYFNIDTRSIDRHEANNALYDVVEYCEARSNGWSLWKGLLVAADHLASSINEQVYNVLEYAFTRPNLAFYHQKSRQSNRYPLSQIDVSDARYHTLVTAPTGAGKTDFLLRRTTGRVFYTLPFQASINAMYQRFKDDLKDTTTDLRILHAASRIAIERNKIEERAIQDKAGASLKVLTPYQLAAIAFGTRGYEAIMIDLKGCDVILDEIHTYTDISRAIVLKIIDVLRYLNCRIHVGTATMPTNLKDDIRKLLGKANTYEVTLKPEQLDDFDRHIVHKISDRNESLSFLKEAVEHNQKILIVCNQVKRAQEVYTELSEKFSKLVPCMLIHSCFRRKDRKKLEYKLKEVYNKNHGPCIVVSTQVVEVSLDISFDLMITEAAPLDSLIQRFGRINRVRQDPKKHCLKQVYVMAPPENEKDALPYNLEVVQKSFKILPDSATLHEREVQGMIDLVYENASNKSIDLMTAFRDGRFLIKELWHRNKSVLIDQLEIESVTCIRESDHDAYLECERDVRSEYEIPVSYKSIGFRGLDQEKKIGTRPFIIPDKAYDENSLGLLISEAESANYKAEVFV